MSAKADDLYKRLGVARECEQGEITKAYRQLAKQHHPDNGGDAAEFRAIQTAYDVLSDPARRAHYDATGELSEFEEAEKTLAQMLDSLLGPLNPRENIFAKCEAEIQRNSALFAAEIPDCEADTRRLMAIKARVKIKGQRDVITPLIEAKMLRLENRLKALRDGITLANQMLVLLRDYEYDAPKVLGRGTLADFAKSGRATQGMVSQIIGDWGFVARGDENEPG